MNVWVAERAQPRGAAPVFELALALAAAGPYGREGVRDAALVAVTQHGGSPALPVLLEATLQGRVIAVDEAEVMPGVGERSVEM